MAEIDIKGAVCPVPIFHKDIIVMGHGSGGKMGADLITKIFLPAFDNEILGAGDDGAVLNVPAGRIAISTDSHVVAPLFFSGGDIGHLSVCGTVNDVSMMGAEPLYMSVGFIIEEGLAMETLQRVVLSMKTAADEAGIKIVTGDTKVVQRGKADGLYINTTGVGIIRDGTSIGGKNAKPGDVVILSGTIGDHGIAVLAARGELGFETDIRSDSAPLNHLVSAILDASPNIHVLRDPTRGGVATTLNEIARQSHVGIIVNEASIPVRPAVASVCEMLGFDPMYVANEGKLIAIVAPEDARQILAAMRRNKYGEDAVIIGEVQSLPRDRVLMKTELGSTRVIDVLMGEMLPRIC
jgi:hydrogenase expression/formation protein HypE